MKEHELEEEYERLCNDMTFAREKVGVCTEGELTEADKNFFEYQYPKEKEKLIKRLNYYRTWNKNEKSGVPKRYEDCWFDNFICNTKEDERHKEAVISFVDRQDNDGILLMTGDRGTGKTHLGTAAVRATLGTYVTMEDLIYKVESSLNFKSPQTEEEVFHYYSTLPFLVIDEIGRSLKVEKETEILSYILRKRFDNQLPVIIISNLDKKTLIKKLGEAVKDRLTQVASSIEFTGESYRINKRK